jgi:uncharacterized protein
MVLLIAGPATNIATLGVVGKTLGRKTAVVYVLVIVISALAGGFLFDRFLGSVALSRVGAGAAGDAGGFELPYPLQVATAIILAGLILYHVGKKIGDRFRRR